MVHSYVLNGYHIAIDGNSGSVHLIDQLAYDILNCNVEIQDTEQLLHVLGEQYSKDNILEAQYELKTLINAGTLFASIEDLEKASNQKKSNNSVKALCLHIAHDCNLRCKYCFASEGDYNSGKSMMSLEVAKKSVDYLIRNSKGRKNVEIDFFGGEPLMNFDIVKETVLYAKQIEKLSNKEFYFTLTTNGVLLDQDKIAFINTYMDNVVISIDGRKEIHDAIRPNRDGLGSYDRIVPRALDLVAARNGKRYYVRGTFTAYNKDFAKDVMHLADLGFKEISVEPVVGSGKAYHFTQNDIEDLKKAYDNLAVQYIHRLESDQDFNFYHFNINVFDGPCLYKRITACGAGGEYLAVAPEGTLYPCHQFVGESVFVIGDVFSGIKNEQVGIKFRDNTIISNETCQTCWAKLFCSGGCHANAYFSNGDIKKPNELSCTLQKKRIECAIMIQAWRAEHGKV